MGSATNLTKRRILANLALVASVGAVLLLFWFPPAAHRFYPACPIHEYLGLLCPGCGATRAVSALLHGDVAQAVRLNALMIVLLPFALAFAVRSYALALQDGKYSWPKVPTAALYTCVAAAAVFTTVRNLGW